MKYAFDQSFNLLHDEVYPKYLSLLEKFEHWYKLAQIDYSKVEPLSTALKEIDASLEEFEKKLELDNRQFSEYLESFSGIPPVRLDRDVKNRLKAYVGATGNLKDIINENVQIMNALDGCTFNFEE